MVEIALFATFHKTFGDGLEFLPTRADLLRLRRGNFAVMRGLGDDLKEVGELLHDLVGGGNQIMWMRDGPGILDKEAVGALANPLGDALVPGAFDQRLQAVERVAHAAAGGVFRRFGPFVKHRCGKAQIFGHLFR